MKSFLEIKNNILKSAHKISIHVTKTCLVSLALLFFQMSYTDLSAQSTALTLNMKNVSIEEVLNAIETKTDYKFLYNKQLVDVTQKTTVVCANKDVQQVLKNMLQEAGINFNISGKQIVLTAPKNNESAGLKRTLSGQVTDEKGEPIIGASVVVKDSKTGTITDINGNFKIEANENSILFISYVGYINQEVKVTSKPSLYIVLKEDNRVLNEVVVVGYGTMNKRDVTTSIASIGGKDLKEMPVGNFDQALIGRLSGIQIMQNSGRPNAGTDIRVRGTGSITAGIEPLFVVDGVPLDRSSGALEVVDMNDIETIEVLKDASSAAIYGSRGSNGVVIITTKKGKNGKTTVEYQGSIGFQKLSKKISMLNAYQYAEFSRDGHNGSYLDAVPTGSPDDPNSVRTNSWDKIPPELLPYLAKTQGLTDTDWQDEIYQTAPITRHSVAVSGGNDKSKYYISGNYLSQKGIIINSDYERYGARLNYSFNTGKTKFEINFSPSYSIENRVNSDGAYGDEGIVQSALAMCPIWPVYNPDGTYNYQGNGYWRIGTDYQHNEVINPVAEAMLVKNIIYHGNLNGNMLFDWEIVKDLHYKLNSGIIYNNYYNDYYRPSTLPLYGWKYYNAASNPVGKSSNTTYLNWLIENTLNYTKSFGKNNLNAVVGLTAQKEQMKKAAFNTTGAPNDLVQNVAGGTTLTTYSYDSQAWSLASLLGRVQYNYDNKYLLSVALRTDGSSRFGKNQRWGYFPSASAGWRIISEPFMQQLSWISNLKLRTSFGVSGNFKIGNYEQTPLLSYKKVIFGSGEGSVNTGISPSQFANDDLSWEKTAMFNLGLDASFIKDRVGFEVDVYNSNTYDLLLNVPVPTITGFGTALQNIGQVNNKGIEFSLILHNTFGKFKWDGRYNISKNINKVVALGNENAPIIKSAGTTTAYWKTEVGKPIGNYYLLQYDGVFESQSELDSYPHFANTKVGDFRFIDTDNDNAMDVSKDRAIVGNYMPKFTYGFTNDFSYKGIVLSVSFQGVYGNKILNLSKRYIANMEGNINNMTVALDRFVSVDNPGSGLVNRATRKQTGNNGTISTYHLEDGSYLRLQNVTLGYNIPKKWIGKLKMQSLKVYASGQNLITFTKYTGYNPEVNNSNGDQLTPGLDYGSYPLSKTYSIGLNVSF